MSKSEAVRALLAAHSALLSAEESGDADVIRHAIDALIAAGDACRAAGVDPIGVDMARPDAMRTLFRRSRTLAGRAYVRFELERVRRHFRGGNE